MQLVQAVTIFVSVRHWHDNFKLQPLKQDSNKQWHDKVHANPALRTLALYRNLVLTDSSGTVFLVPEESPCIFSKYNLAGRPLMQPTFCRIYRFSFLVCNHVTWQGGHVGGQNNRIFSRRIYMKIVFSPQKRLFPEERNAFVFDHQHSRRDVTCKPAIESQPC